MLASELKLLLYISLIACLFVPWGIAPPDGTAGALAVGIGFVCRQACRRRRAACAVRNLHRQDARVPRAGIPRRRADARPAWRPCCCLFRGACDACAAFHLRHRPSAGRLAGAGELHAALPGPALRAAQYISRCTRWCWRRRSPGRLSCRMRRIFTHRRDRAGVQGHRHSGGAAPDHRAARHSP